MKRIRQGWNTLRQNRRSGVSLIVALCAVAALIGLSLSIVYSSSMLLSRANRKIGRERCYQLAQSFAQTLDSELRAYNTLQDRGNEGDDWPKQSGTFYEYLVNYSNTLPDYDADDPLTTFSYSTGITDGEYGKVTISLRKKTTQEEPEGGEFSYADRNDGTDRAERNVFPLHQFTISVTVELGADSYTYTTQYDHQVSYDPEYTWKNNTTDDSFNVFWLDDNEAFSRSNSADDIVTPEDDENVTISYTYKKGNGNGNGKYHEYTPVHEWNENQSGGGTDE